MKRNWILLTLIFVSLWVFGQYQNLNFQDSPKSLGLNYTSTVDITQDSRGYLWFCTYVGLYRYNGNDVKHYTYKGNDGNGLSSNKVISILSTKNGELFVSTLLGSVMKYNYNLDRFQYLEESNAHTLRRNMWSLFEDKNGTIWCGTEKGISLLDYQSTELRNDETFLKSNVNNKKVNFISNAETEYVWVCSESGLFVFHVSDNQELTEINHFQFEFKGYSQEQSNFISYIAKTGDPLEDKVKVFCKSGIIDFDFSKGFDQVTYTLINPTNQHFAFPRAMIPLIHQNDGYIIGTNDGVKIYNEKGKLSEETFLQDVIIRDLYEDQFGTVWLGTESGLYVLDQNPAQFRNEALRNNFKHNKDLIEGICASNKTGDLWVGWQNGQISRIKKVRGKYLFQEADHYDILLRDKTLHRDRISYMEIDDDGQIWLATQGAGVLSFNENTRKSNHQIATEIELNDQNGLIDNYIMSIENEEDCVWIGTWKNGLIHYDKLTGKLTDVPISKGDDSGLRKAPIVRLESIREKGIRYLSIGTGGEGVFIERIDDNPFSTESIHLNSKAIEDFRIHNNFITDLTYKNGILFIGSENGLNLFEMEDMQVRKFKNEQKIAEYIVHGIKVLDDGNIWLSTNSNGILKIGINDSTETVKHFVKDVYSNYVMSPPVLDSENILMFAGTEGLTLLNPFSQPDIKKPPIPMITGLRLNNIGVNEGTNGDENDFVAISEIDELNLSYKEKIITFELNAMHSSDRQPLTYAYKLEGFHEDWVYTNEEENLVNFTNLPFSDYTFYFKAANSNNLWSETKSIKISIEPPWWRSITAYFIYLLIILGIAYLISRLISLRHSYRENLKLAELEKEKAEELNKLKLDFYTVISHELRTPLTMIIAPIEQLLKNPLNINNSKSLEFIHTNAKKLLGMVNQLLDIRKLDSKMVFLNFRKFDFIEFINEIISSFKPALAAKEISISFVHNTDSLDMAFDEVEMEKVFSNLFTNALKYTSPGGNINIKLEFNYNENRATVYFSDDGKGIMKKELPFIFDQYYQTEEHIHEGYGLGLSIVKSIIELHKGSITVDSEVGHGTTFIMNIPTDLRPTRTSGKELKTAKTDFEELSGNDNVLAEENDRITILIVEDSPDIKEFLKENLKEKYNILLAENGEEGLAEAISKVPDLIITDIAMPKMDGLEMCKNLKKNKATSHIPVIVLTARTSMNFKLQGYEYGINAFVTKPFNFDLLNKQIDSTLDYLEIVKQKYRHNQNAEAGYAFYPKLPEISSGDEEFVQAITDFIMDNISNSDLSIEEIADSEHMSQVQFYRKLKAITGITPKKLLRELRLQRAKQLLEQTDMNISEVTYAVGFNDLKYFRSKFKELFDCNPSDVKKANKVSVE